MKNFMTKIFLKKSVKVTSQNKINMIYLNCLEDMKVFSV